MSIGVLSLLALLPILAVILFLVIMRWPASKAMPIAYVVVVVLGLFVWKLPVAQIAAASVNGIVTTINLLYIIFGAIGTPILVGVSTGLSASETIKANAGDWSAYLAAIGAKVAILHTIAGILVPLFMVSLLTKYFGKNKSFREGLQAWPFAVFAALAMIVPYLIVANVLGPEFPSMFGGLIGLAIVIQAAKKGWFMPKGTWDFASKENWASDWIGKVEIKEISHRSGAMSLAKAWAPYVLIGLFLVLSRLQALPFDDWLKAFQIEFTNMFGTEISASTQPLYLPGTIFILVTVITYFLHQMDGAAYARAWKNSFKTTLLASVALIWTVPMVQVFINSGGGAAGFERMPIVLAEGVAALTGSFWPIISPFIGALGAFIAGSNTVSNMMFSLFQYGVGERIGVFDPTWIVALQAVGGAAGNMVCVHNVVAASATVGLVGKEGALIRKTIFPMTYYALFAGSIGYTILFGFGMGAVIAALIVIAAVYLIATNSRHTVSPADSKGISR